MPRSSFLGDFEHLVLLAIRRLGEEAYGMTVRTELEERTGRHISLGALYTALSRLERKGFVKSSWSDPTPERGGRSKRYLTLTKAGDVALSQSRDLLLAMWKDVPTKGRTR